MTLTYSSRDFTLEVWYDISIAPPISVMKSWTDNGITIDIIKKKYDPITDKFTFEFARDTKIVEDEEDDGNYIERSFSFSHNKNCDFYRIVAFKLNISAEHAYRERKIS